MSQNSWTGIWTVFFTAMLPLWELKGAIPMGIIGFNMSMEQAFWIAYLGSCIPCIFIIFFIEKFLNRLTESKVKFFKKVAVWIKGKVRKHQNKINKYGYLGVFLFVAIPLPGTGIWTGSLLAAMLGLKPKLVIPLIFIANLVAGLAMLGITALGGHILNL